MKFDTVIDWCAFRLLYTRFSSDEGITQPVIETNETITDALHAAIGLGGSTWIPDAFKPYWMFNFYPSLKIELLKTIDNKLIAETISAKQLIASAQKIWNENKEGQLSLF